MPRHESALTSIARCGRSDRAAFCAKGYANAAAEILAGYRLEDMAGRALYDVVHHTKPDGSHYTLHECLTDRAFPE